MNRTSLLPERATAVGIAVLAALVAVTSRAGDAAAYTLLIGVATLVAQADVRTRRVPNAFVLAALAGGLFINSYAGGWAGLASSALACVACFAIAFVAHLLGLFGPGDVKLFAAVGAVLTVPLVLPASVLVMLAAAVFTLAGAAYVKLAPEGEVRTVSLPYSLAITVGSLLTLAFSRA